ncbi:MFS transporter [Subtercola lobariae]|uniref:MFS transporter n=1 Tax=Subtercola lobariae TaxID=1588641 RepID=A0A917B3H0_9MICO|nr:MFS transporter [Subtercola lobariae]GGF21083.1 MFS transporter [Subtercola lobariae]
MSTHNMSNPRVEVAGTPARVDVGIRSSRARRGSRASRNRRTLPPMAAFIGTALVFAGLYLAAGAPTSLLVLFEKEWGFPAWVLTVAFAAYAIGLLATLLVAGSLSDHLGRRPVLVGSLAVELAAMLLFVFATDITWVIVARVIQGVATGAATSAFTASVVELAPDKYKRLGSIIGGTAAAGGLGLGALLTGVAVQFTSNANVIVFTTLSIVMVIGLFVAIFSAETVTRRVGALRSLIPRVSIPVAARGEFRASIAVHIAAWMLAGLFLGLVPTIIRDIFHIDSGLINGITVFLEPGAAAVAGFVFGRFAARRTTLIGGLAVFAGAVTIVAAIAAGMLPLLWVGGLIGGVGFGASFSGALRTVGPLAKPHERAGLFAGVYVVAYLAFGVPVIVAGQLIAPLGLLTTVIAFAAAIVVAAAVGVAAQLRMARRQPAVAATPTTLAAG